MTPEEALKNSVRGQYVFGEVKDKAMQAYRQSPDVDTKSKTETYIALKLFIDNWRWAGVPFYIRTGKAMTARKTEVAIQFKKAPGVLFRDVDGGELSNSRLVFRIQPDEGVQMRFSVKQPGRKVKLSDVNMNFRYSDYFKSAPSTGYETLDLRLHDRRRDPVPAGRQRRGRLGGGAAAARCLVGRARPWCIGTRLARRARPRPTTCWRSDGRKWLAL